MQKTKTIIKDISIAIIIFIILANTMTIKKEEPKSTQTTTVPEGWTSVKLLTANVGNVDYSCRGKYNYKLCNVAVENNIKENINKIKPDIIFLQELLHPSQCDGWVEKDSNKVCHTSHNSVISNQARRILGNNYSIVCASRVRENSKYPRGMECIAISLEVGEIEGCPRGEICFSTENADNPSEKCNPEFIIMSVFAKINGIRIKLINAHPDSRSKICRDNALGQVFNSILPSLTPKEKTIIAGDFNFDPFKNKENSPNVWEKNVGTIDSGKPFYYHSGISEITPPYPTVYFLGQKKTFDHVVSNFAMGHCKTLGEAPETSRLDGGKGMDHRALYCELWIPPK